MEKKYTRYYLHRKAKKEGFKVDARKRIVFCQLYDVVSDAANFYLKKLVEKYRYTIQLEF
ncbi:MAG: hypothetical protein FWC34_10975 [Bacteroidetes bacterium]|nr:hypothetical protein [Bacteroidota bacterium]MCL2302936.1 hypothetical protein [Lentimicrobiaceae bacterium]